MKGIPAPKKRKTTNASAQGNAARIKRRYGLWEFTASFGISTTFMVADGS